MGIQHLFKQCRTGTGKSEQMGEPGHVRGGKLLLRPALDHGGIQLRIEFLKCSIDGGRALGFLLHLRHRTQQRLGVLDRSDRLVVLPGLIIDQSQFGPRVNRRGSRDVWRRHNLLQQTCGLVLIAELTV